MIEIACSKKFSTIADTDDLADRRKLSEDQVYPAKK
jgi:hypothetical protein